MKLATQLHSWKNSDQKKELNVDEIVTITQVIFSKNTSNNFLINMLGV